MTLQESVYLAYLEHQLFAAWHQLSLHKIHRTLALADTKKIFLLEIADGLSLSRFLTIVLYSNQLSLSHDISGFLALVELCRVVSCRCFLVQRWKDVGSGLLLLSCPSHVIKATRLSWESGNRGAHVLYTKGET